MKFNAVLLGHLQGKGYYELRGFNVFIGDVKCYGFE